MTAGANRAFAGILLKIKNEFISRALNFSIVLVPFHLSYSDVFNFIVHNFTPVIGTHPLITF